MLKFRLNASVTLAFAPFMDLIKELESAGFKWSVAPTWHEWAPRTRPVLSLQVTLDAGQGPRHRVVPAHAELPLSRMLALALREHFKGHPMLERWERHESGLRTKLAYPEVLGNLPEAMHTALRKLCDSNESVLTWNALHHMHSQDCRALWDTAREALEACFANNASPPRRVVAERLAQMLMRCLELRQREREVRDEAGEGVRERTDSEAFALLTMLMGVRSTSMEEWMWGWLGYVVEDAQPQAAEAKGLIAD